MRRAPFLLVGLSLGLAALVAWTMSGPPLSSDSPGPKSVITEPAAHKPEAKPHKAPLVSQPASNLPPIADRQALGSSETTGAKAQPGAWRTLFGEAEHQAPSQPPLTLRIVGRLVKAGQPAKGHSVILTPLGENKPFASVGSLDDGSFVLDAPLGKPSYNLRIDGPGSFPQSKPLPPLADNLRLNLGIIEVRVAIPLNGLCLDANGKPVPGSWIQVGEKQPHGITMRGTVASEGAFQLPKAADKSLVFAGAPGHSMTTVLVSELRAQDGPSPVVSLNKGHATSFPVTDSTGTPIQNARVFAVPQDYVPFIETYRSFTPTEALLDSPGVLETRSDQAGQAHFPELSARPYYIAAAAPDFIPTRPRSFLPASQKPHTISLKRAPLLSMRGVYLNPSTKQFESPEGLRLLATASKFGNFWVEHQTDGQGLCQTKLPGEADWTYVAWAPGFKLASGAVVTTQLLDAPPAKFRLELRSKAPAEISIVDKEGQAIQGARVTGSARLKLTRTPTHEAFPLASQKLAEGFFQLPAPEQLEQQEWQIKAPGFLPSTFTCDLRGPAPSTVTLTPSYSFTLRILTESGEPIPRAKVTLAGLYMPTQPAWPTEAQRLAGTYMTAQPTWRTDNQGLAVIEGLSKGQATVLVRGPYGRLQARHSLKVGPGMARTTTVNLR